MKTKKVVSLKAIIALVVLIVCTTVNAQVKYDSNGRFTIGNTTSYHDGYKFYDVTIKGNLWLTGPVNGNYFQIDTNPAATRLASHYGMSK